MNTNKLLEKLKSDINEQDCNDYLNGTYKKLAQLIGIEALLERVPATKNLQTEL